MGIVSWLICRGLTAVTGSIPATGAAVLTGAVLYITLIFALRAITDEELKRIPKGEKLLKLTGRISKRKDPMQ